MSQPQISSIGGSQTIIQDKSVKDQSKQVIDQFLECKRENQERLKNVKNLEDLISFKVTTIADKLKDNKESQITSEYGLDFFTKLCDPLLANQHYPSLTKKAYLGSQSIHQQRRQRNNQSRTESQQIMPEIQQHTRINIPSQVSINQSYQDPQTPPKDLAKDDPVKFLQQYFKKPEIQQKKKPIASNYIMAKYQRMEDKKKSQSVNRSFMGTQSKQQPGGEHEISLIDQQSIPPQFNAESSLYMQNQDSQNFFEAKASSLPPQTKLSQQTQEINKVDSLNVLNFQKMRDEIKKMFVDVDDNRQQENILSHRNQYNLSQERIKGSYQQQLKELATGQSSSDEYGDDKDDGYLLDDQDSFIDFPLMNLKNDNEKIHKDRWKELQKRERKIQKILQNKYSKKAKINYLSDIQSVKAIGFERFSKDIQYEQRRNNGFQSYKQDYNTSKYEDQKQLKQQLNSLRQSQLKDRSEKDKSLELVKFNKNRNIEQLQQKLLQAQTQQTQEKFNINDKKKLTGQHYEHRAMSLDFQNYGDQSEGPMQYSMPETQKPSQYSSKQGMKEIDNTLMSFEEYKQNSITAGGQKRGEIKIQDNSNEFTSSIELNNAEQQVSSQQFSPQPSVTREVASEYTQRGKVMFIKKTDDENNNTGKIKSIPHEDLRDKVERKLAQPIYNPNQPLRQKVVIPQLNIQDNYQLQKSSSRLQKQIAKGLKSQNSSKAFIQQSGVQGSGYESQSDPVDQAREELHHQIMEAQAKRSQAWSPRRFKKFPRFTIFLNRDEDKQEYQKDNIICLNPDFMNFLLNPASSEAEQNIALQIQDNIEAGSLEQAFKIYSKNSEKFKQIDPFEKVLLTKGIDNQILTSFRTLAKTNNLISDTFKIVHNKFSPFPNKNKQMSKFKQQYSLYPINEELINDEEMNDAQFIQENLKNIYNSNFSSLDMNFRASGIDQQHVNADLRETSKQQQQIQNEESKVIYSINTPPAKTMYLEQNDDIYKTSDIKQVLMSPQHNHVPTLPSVLSAQANKTQGNFYKKEDTIDEKTKTPNYKEGSIFSQGMSTEYKHQQQALYQQQQQNQQQDQIYAESKDKIEMEREQLRQLIRIKKSKSKEKKDSVKQPFILQKVDPIELFGMRRLSKDELNESQQEILIQQLETGLLQEHSRNLYEREVMILNMANQQNAMPKKKGVSFAGGFQAFNMKGDMNKQQSHTIIVPQPPKEVKIQNISNKEMNNLSELDVIGPSSQQNNGVLTGLFGASMTNNNAQKNQDLNNDERIEFTKKLTLPPSNKLKNMIDELYTKEKKYVKHYVREDYIEQNNFIFDLQKCHNLGTSGYVKNKNMSQKRAMKANEIFIGAMNNNQSSDQNLNN